MNSMRIGIIGGSGLGKALAEQTTGTRHQIITPFGETSDAVVETSWSGTPVYFLSRHGPSHLLNPSRIPCRANIFALKQLGVTHIIASGAVGSLRDFMHPGELVLPDQVLDQTHLRASTFYDEAAVHVELAEPFCPVLRQVLRAASEEIAREQSIKVHDQGCYVCMEGPAFSTRAQSLANRLLGADLIGMTAMPEAKLAREAEIAYAMVAMVTDYDSWKNKPSEPTVDRHDLLKEIIGNLDRATNNAITLIRKAVEMLAMQKETLPESPAHRALELAIWSDKSRIDRRIVEQLAPLWIKYWEV